MNSQYTTVTALWVKPDGSAAELSFTVGDVDITLDQASKMAAVLAGVVDPHASRLTVFMLPPKTETDQVSSGVAPSGPKKEYFEKELDNLWADGSMKWETRRSESLNILVRAAEAGFYELVVHPYTLALMKRIQGHSQNGNANNWINDHGYRLSTTVFARPWASKPKSQSQTDYGSMIDEIWDSEGSWDQLHDETISLIRAALSDGITALVVSLKTFRWLEKFPEFDDYLNQVVVPAQARGAVKFSAKPPAIKISEL